MLLGVEKSLVVTHWRVMIVFAIVVRRRALLLRRCLAGRQPQALSQPRGLRHHGIAGELAQRFPL